MGSSTDQQRTVSSASWLTVLVVAFVIAGSVALGVVGVLGTGNDAGQNSMDAGASDVQQAAPAISGDVALEEADAKFEGASDNDTFGNSLAHGDVNGDGVEDVIVGAPQNNSSNGYRSGAVFVFYGPVDERTLNAESANVTLEGVDESDRAGYSVAAGDVDDDGTDDVVIGAPLNDREGSSAGVAYVVHGGDLSENRSLGDANRTYFGEATDDRAGWSVATVNRSGGDDVLVGAPQHNDTGAVYVVSGNDSANTASDENVPSLANATARLDGEAPGDHAGWSVADAGDFDGDNATDFVVGARTNNSTGPAAGAAYVVTENVSGNGTLADASVKLAGDESQDNAGWSVAGAGDVNNDSYGDVVVGAPFNDRGGSSAGATYVVYGGNDTTDATNLSDAGVVLVGEGEDDLAGYDVSSTGAGNATCGEYADVLVGAPGNNSTGADAGAAYFVESGENDSGERNLSAATAKLAGEAEGDRAGTAVAAGGNVTDNETTDLLVGATRNDSGAVDTGAAYLVSEDCPEPEPEKQKTTEEPTTEKTTEEPTTEEPTTEKTTEETTTEETTTEKTTTEETTTDELTTEEPTTTADGAPPLTEVPNETTEVPNETTEVPNETTEVPNETTEVPNETTEVPNETTSEENTTEETTEETTTDGDADESGDEDGDEESTDGDENGEGDADGDDSDSTEENTNEDDENTNEDDADEENEGADGGENDEDADEEENNDEDADEEENGEQSDENANEDGEDDADEENEGADGSENEEEDANEEENDEQSDENANEDEAEDSDEGEDDSENDTNGSLVVF